MEINLGVERFVLTDSNPLFFTSDLHFFHKRIIEFTGRPTTFEGLTEWIINQCNTVIPENGATTIHNGDMFFGCTVDEAVAALSRLHGDWWFILGNHDNPDKLSQIINAVNKIKKTNHRILGWYHRLLVVKPSLVVGEKHKKKLLVLCHFPIEEWDGMSHGSYMIHGHLHGGGSEHSDYPLKKMHNRFDIGLDNSHTFTPFSFDDVSACIRKGRAAIIKDGTTVKTNR